MSTSSTGTTTSSIGVSNTGTVFFSGLASGIDTQSLITNAVNAKLLVKKTYTDQISTNTNKISSWQNLNTKTTALQTALTNLTTATLGSGTNPFGTTQVTLGTSDGSDASNILSATTGLGAQAGNYSLVVGQLAKAFSATSNVQTTATTALNFNGTFDIGETGKTAQTITVNSTMTLADVANAINATTLTSGVKADILQQANGQFKLVISGNDTNQAVNITNVTGDNVLNNLGATDSSNNFVAGNIIQPAVPAMFTLNNVPITSDSNTVSNVLTGLTLTLTSAAPSTTINMTVGNNTTGATTAIQAFVTAYNTLINTVAANKLVDSDGTVDANAYLFGETTNSSLGTMLNTYTSGMYGSGIFNGLRSLGITLDENNNLVVDSAALSTALTNNFGDVASVFMSNGSNTGIADSLKTALNQYTDSSTGQIQNEINSLTTQDTALQTKADAIQQAADDYETQLISSYAKMETQIQSANLLKQQITAILDGSTAPKS